MKKEALAYRLLNEAYLFEDHPEVIRDTRTMIDPNFNQQQLVFGRNRIDQDWPRDVTVVVSGSQPVDLLLCTPLMEIISERAARIIQEIAPDDVEFLPVQVLYEDGKPYTAMKYWAFRIYTVLDALDWEHTTWIGSLPPDKNNPLAYLKVIKPCLYANKIENKHIFRVEIAGKIDTSRFVSLELKRRLQKEKCVVGIDFGPTKTT